MKVLPDPSDRRKSPRYALSEIVEIYIVGSGGGYLGCGVLRDLSDTGAGVHMDTAVTPGTVVDLSNEKGSVRAICRHNSPAFTGYVVGFEFTDGPSPRTVAAWSPLPATW